MMSRKEILTEIIIGYRKVVEKRYNYTQLKEKYEVPPSFNEAKTNEFKEYFLGYIYPDPQKRVELDEAFQNLDSYIKHPEKLLRILLDSGRLLFKYGRHLPKILRAGMKALKSFRTATVLENKLVENAINIPVKPPFNSTEIDTLLASLSAKEVIQFLESSQLLFETLHDRKLVEKIIEIVEHLITKMESRPAMFGPKDIKGLSIGRDIIKEGAQLFYQLPEKEQRAVLDLVVQIERDALEAIF